MVKINQNKWVVAYTLPKREKKARLALMKAGYEVFLPLVQEFRQWSDRKKVLQLPLFPGYLFIKDELLNLEKILRIKEIIRLITFNNKIARVSDEEIEMVKTLMICPDLTCGKEFYYQEGARVMIREGPFKGMVGLVVKKNNKTRLIVRLEALQQGLSIDIPQYMLGSSKFLDC